MVKSWGLGGEDLGPVGTGVGGLDSGLTTIKMLYF